VSAFSAEMIGYVMGIDISLVVPGKIHEGVRVSVLRQLT
jgi:hypothetical protein